MPRLNEDPEHRESFVSTRQSEHRKHVREVLKSEAEKQAQSTILRVVHPNAAGIDVGSTFHVVAVPEGRDEQPVREFGVYTEDLYAMAQWLQQCGIEEVAVESTGNYWEPLVDVLELLGFRVTLLHSNYTRNVPGKKSDIHDAQWIRELHMFGLLPAAFRPPRDVDMLRTLWRHRQRKIAGKSQCILRMQKELTEMNVLVHHAVSDITGETGMRILRAIVAGERDPKALARFRDYRCKKSEEEIAKALTGAYRDDHLIVLEQELEHYDFLEKQIHALDEKVKKALANIRPARERKAGPESENPEPKKPKGNAPRVNVLDDIIRLVGAEALKHAGLDINNVITLIAECGVSLEEFPTEHNYTSWLTLAPGCKKSGGKVMSAKTRKSANRAAAALRIAAQSLERTDTYLGAFYRRKRAQKGPQVAITATARKLAVIYYRAVRYGVTYEDKGADYYEEQWRQSTIKYLEKKAKSLGFKVVADEEADMTELEKKVTQATKKSRKKMQTTRK